MILVSRTYHTQRVNKIKHAFDLIDVHYMKVKKQRIEISNPLGTDDKYNLLIRIHILLSMETRLQNFLENLEKYVSPIHILCLKI